MDTEETLASKTTGTHYLVTEIFFKIFFRHITHKVWFLISFYYTFR